MKAKIYTKINYSNIDDKMYYPFVLVLSAFKNKKIENHLVCSGVCKKKIFFFPPKWKASYSS